MPVPAERSAPPGTSPPEQAAMKCLYLVTRSLDPTGRGRVRWAMRWKPALNAFAITFEGRIVPSTTNCRIPRDPDAMISTRFIGTLPISRTLSVLLDLEVVECLAGMESVVTDEG